jgi:hypothetical protein
MSVNPKTGFLEQPNLIDGFDSVKKQAMLRYLEVQPFKIKYACQHVGINEATFYDHINRDATFAKYIQDLRERRVEEIEQKLADMALKDEQVADRIFFLKAWKPNRYNPVNKSEQKITVEITTNGASLALDRESTIETTIATNTPTYAQITTHNASLSVDEHVTDRAHGQEGDSVAKEKSMLSPDGNVAPGGRP